MTSIGPLHLIGVHDYLQSHLHLAHQCYLKDKEESLEHFINIFQNTENSIIRCYCCYVIGSCCLDNFKDRDAAIKCLDLGIDLLKDEDQFITTPLTTKARDQIRTNLIKLKARILFEVRNEEESGGSDEEVEEVDAVDSNKLANSTKKKKADGLEVKKGDSDAESSKSDKKDKNKSDIKVKKPKRKLLEKKRKPEEEEGADDEFGTEVNVNISKQIKIEREEDIISESSKKDDTKSTASNSENLKTDVVSSVVNQLEFYHPSILSLAEMFYKKHDHREAVRYWTKALHKLEQVPEYMTRHEVLMAYDKICLSLLKISPDCSEEALEWCIKRLIFCDNEVLHYNQDITIKDNRLNTNTDHDFSNLKQELDQHCDEALIFFMKQVEHARTLLDKKHDYEAQIGELSKRISMMDEDNYEELSLRVQLTEVLLKVARLKDAEREVEPIVDLLTILPKDCPDNQHRTQAIEQRVDSAIESINKQNTSEYLIQLGEELLADKLLIKSEKCFTHALQNTSSEARRLVCLERLCYMGLMKEEHVLVKERAREGMEICNRLKTCEEVEKARSTLEHYHKLSNTCCSIRINEQSTLDVTQYCPSMFDAHIWEHLQMEKVKESDHVGCIRCKLGHFVSSVGRKERFIMMMSVKEELAIFGWARKSAGLENGVGFGAHIPVVSMKDLNYLKGMFDRLEKIYEGVDCSKMRITVFGGYGCDPKTLKNVLKGLRGLFEKRRFKNVDVSNVVQGYQGDFTLWYLGLDLMSGRFVSHSYRYTEETSMAREENLKFKLNNTFDDTLEITEMEL